MASIVIKTEYMKNMLISKSNTKINKMDTNYSLLVYINTHSSHLCNRKSLLATVYGKITNIILCTKLNH